MKKLISCILAVMMLLSASAIAETAGTIIEDKDYDVIANHSQYPLVTDGSVTLTVAVPMDDAYATDDADTWFWPWWSEVTGIKFEVEQILKSGLTERKNLMFASGVLPDLLVGMSLSPNEVSRYGMSEKMLLSFKDLATPEIMPNLAALYEMYPQGKAVVTTPDGEQYTLPFFVNGPGLHGESARVFIDQARLDAVNKQLPQTLDELNEVLYAFKEADPDCIPLGGSYEAMNPSHYIFKAMGFLGQGDTDGSAVTIRNDEAVIPAGDPLYKEYLTLMNKWYADGIISGDFFTADSTAVNAQMSEGKLGIYPFVPFTVTPDYEDYSHWVSVTPLTSEWNDTKQWVGYFQYSMGGLAASAETEHAELIARLVDFFYSDYGFDYAWKGCYYNSKDSTENFKGVYSVVDYSRTNAYGEYIMLSEQYDEWNIEGKYESLYDLKYHNTMGVFAFGNDGCSVELSKKYGTDVAYASAAMIKGLSFKYEEDWQYWLENVWKDGANVNREPAFDRQSTEGQFRGSMYDNISPYETDYHYPTVVYFTEEQAQEMNDLQTVIEPFIEKETAKFITGVRSLDEFDDYLAELEAYGFREWEQYYKDAWNSYKANLK